MVMDPQAKAVIDAKKAKIEANGHVCPITLVELFMEEDPTHNWILPGLLEREDRLILTGAEGFGKSTFFRQIGVCAALGINPVTFHTIPKPLRVFSVDCENSKKQLRREYGKFMELLTPAERSETMPRYFLESKRDGLILDDKNDKMGDRKWLEARIAGSKADLLVIGPMYKMMGADPLDEVPSRNMAKWLDKMREKYKVSVCIEAHSPHNEKYVYGWSGWKRWPEYGFHLDKDGTLTRWRGDREERLWPFSMRRGNEDEWLWMPQSQANVTTESPVKKAELVEAFFKTQFENAAELGGKALCTAAYNALGASESFCYKVADKMGIVKDDGIWKYHGPCSSSPPIP